MRNRIKVNRRLLVAALEARSIPGDWSSIAGQRGMFALLILHVSLHNFGNGPFECCIFSLCL